MVMGSFQVRTTGEIPLTMMGARNTVPSKMARMVPLGLFHIWERWYSSTRWALGVMVAHLTATPYFLLALAAVDRHLVLRFLAVSQAQVIVFGFQVHKRQNDLVLDLLPQDAGHLVAVHLHQGGGHLDLFHRVSSKLFGCGRIRLLL